MHHANVESFKLMHLSSSSFSTAILLRGG